MRRKNETRNGTKCIHCCADVHKYVGLCACPHMCLQLAMRQVGVEVQCYRRKERKKYEKKVIRRCMPIGSTVGTTFIYWVRSSCATSARLQSRNDLLRIVKKNTKSNQNLFFLPQCVCRWTSRTVPATIVYAIVDITETYL